MFNNHFLIIKLQTLSAVKLLIEKLPLLLHKLDQNGLKTIAAHATFHDRFFFALRKEIGILNVDLIRERIYKSSQILSA